jgi:ATP-dependent DNA helicase DinG
MNPAISLQELDWVPRKEQLEMVKYFNKAIEQNKKFYLIEAPTGTGKSYGIMMMIKEMLKHDKDAKADILTNLLSLQQQYLRDFPFINSFKGKDNYQCTTFNTTCSEGQLLANVHKLPCGQCPFKDAKEAYKKGQVGLLNFAMYINYNMYQPDFLEERKAKTLFIDEAYLFEEVYCDFIESHLSISYFYEMGIDLKLVEIDVLNKITDKHQYADFLTKILMPKIHGKLNVLENKIKDSNDAGKQLEWVKELRHIDRIKCKYNRFLGRVEMDNWILETTVEGGFYTHSIKAVWGTPFMKELWDKYDTIVLLSGTILDKDFFVKLMDLPKADTLYLNLDTPFPIKNRKIYYIDKGKMSYNSIEQTYKDVVPEIKKILEHHKNDKGLIHSGNYKISNWIKNDVRSNRILTHEPKTKDQVLLQHHTSASPTVLVSPVMTNGVDLKNDLARFQILVKIPFPTLDSEKIKLRMKQQPDWYNWKTLCSVIQSYGRIVRSETDYGDTYILDGSFSHLMRKISLPKYVKNALIIGCKKF